MTPDPIDIAVGERLRAFRRANRMSQQELGARLGITFQQIQKYEHGTNRISASMMAHAARALSCTVAELMGEFPEGARLSPRAIEMARLFEALPSERERNAVFNLAKAMLL